MIPPWSSWICHGLPSVCVVMVTNIMPISIAIRVRRPMMAA